MGCCAQSHAEASPATSTESFPSVASRTAPGAASIAVASVSGKRTARPSQAVSNSAAVNPFADFIPVPLPNDRSAEQPRVRATRRTRRTDAAWHSQVRMLPLLDPLPGFSPATQATPDSNSSRNSSVSTAELVSARAQLVRWVEIESADGTFHWCRAEPLAPAPPTAAPVKTADRYAVLATARAASQDAAAARITTPIESIIERSGDEDSVAADDGATSVALSDLQPQRPTGTNPNHRRPALRRSPSRVRASPAPFSW
jgi:hypothetical protein